MTSRRYLILCTVLVFLYGKLDAQHKPAWQFNSYNSIGILAGKSPVAFAAQTVNGMRFKSWFVGAGLGIDNYVMQSFPLFAAVKKEFTIKRTMFFIYTDAGSHFVKHRNKFEENTYSIKTQGKLYLDAGAGIKFKTSARNSIFFTAGNCYKHITNTEANTDEGFPFRNTIRYKFSTISVRLGYQF